MRKLMLSAAALALTLAVTQAFAMGGGGGGGGGGYGGGAGSGPSMSSDDYTVAKRLIKHKQYADAIPHLQLALADKPHDADILNYLGYTKRMVGDYDASLDYYQRALAEDPNHKGVHEYLGELYLQKNDLPSAQKELTTLASLCPSGCDERDTLTKAIASYQPAAAPAATAAPTQTPTQ
jgi:tetratricopeptide (TPR) repeat protein